MGYAEDIPTDKHFPDPESAKMAPRNDITAEGIILEPLQFLLAARRGFHQDPYFAKSHVPDDRAITFRGPSGVKASADRSSRWSRFVRHLGYIPTSTRVGITWFFFYIAVEYGRYTTENTMEGTTRRKGDIYYGLKLGLVTSCIVLALLIAAGRRARKQTIEAISPEFDPESYQCRLLNAMQQRGCHYREVDVISLEKKMAYWKRDSGHRECFTIKGLVDPGCPVGDGGVYDVVVNFWKDGRLNLRFWTGEGQSSDKKPSLFLESAGKSKD